MRILLNMFDKASMTENEFLNLADTYLEKLMERIEDEYSDDDCIREGNVLTIETENNVKIVLNIQSAMKEIWLASPEGGAHYGPSDGKWISTRGGSLLEDDLTALLEKY